MAWIYLAESEDSPWHSPHGLDRSSIVNEIDTAMLCFCRGCDSASFLALLSGTILLASDRPCCPDMGVSISSMGDSHARTSVLQGMERVWAESTAAFSLNSSDSLAIFDRDSFSWKTCQLSLIEDLNEFYWSSLRSGIIRDGRLYQPASLEPNTCERDGSFWPTPCARDYRSPGMSRQRRAHIEDRRGLPLSLWFKIKFGMRLFPTFVEWMMGYPSKFTALEPWAMQWYRSRLRSRSKD